MKRKAVFIDRDGTINREVGYPDSFQKIKIFPHSFEAVKKIKEAGFLAVVITNQSGVGRGLIEDNGLRDIHFRMKNEFARYGVSLDGIYHCPHYIFSENPEYRADCGCRKPQPGMGTQAASDLDIDTARSYMVGDRVEDILFGFNIEATPILVLTGYGKTSQKQLAERGIHPAYIASNLLDAAEWIVTRERNKIPSSLPKGSKRSGR